MIRTSIAELADPIGFDIGCFDNIVQSNLLNGLCRGLSTSCGGITANLDMQLCYISDSITDDTARILERIVEFYKSKNK